MSKENIEKLLLQNLVNKESRNDSEKEREKIRCNMYLDKKNTDTVKKFIKETGLTLSSYFDLLIKNAAEKIEQYDSLAGNEIPEDYIFSEENGKKYYNIAAAHSILGISKDEEGFELSPSQEKKLISGKWKFEFSKRYKIRLCIGKTKMKK